MLTSQNGIGYTLNSLNPNINAWFVLEAGPAGKVSTLVHFDNADPAAIDVSLIDDGGLAPLIEVDGDSFACAPRADGELAEAQERALPYAPVCDWSLCVRNPVSGSRTTREVVAEFLRDHVIFGESIANLIKGAFLRMPLWCRLTRKTSWRRLMA